MDVPPIASYYHEQTIQRYRVGANVFKDSQAMGLMTATRFYGDAINAAADNALTYLRAAERICPAFAGVLEVDKEILD
jgi:hypothetical protein